MRCYHIPAVNLLGVSNSQYCFKIVSPFSHSCYCPCWISFYHYIGKAMTPPCKDPSRGGRYIAANGKSVSYAMYTISTVYACHKANSCDCMFPSIFPSVKTFFFFPLDLSAHVHSVVALVLAMMHLDLPKRRRPFLLC